jgi:hypothetical protein
MNLMQTIEEHKVAFGLLGVAGFVLILLLMRGGSSSQASNPVSQILGYDEQQNELNAQASLQSQQIAAQQDAVDQSAQAQDYQYQEAASAQNEQTDASLIANLYDTQQSAAVQEDQYGSETSIDNTETNAELAATENTNATNLSALQSEYGAADYQADLQAQLYSQGISSSTTLGEDQITALEQAEQDQYNEDSSVISEVGAAGLNHGTTSLEDALGGILGEALGQGSAASTFAQGSAGASEASSLGGTSTLNSIIGSIGNIGKTTVSSLLG